MSGATRTIGISAGMVCLRSGKIDNVLLVEAIGACKLVDPASDYVRAARAVGITFGDRP
jgi:hypothetical protein